MLRFAALLCLVLAGPALADSCWIHNGSLMRLRDSGTSRTFTYESPRPELWDAGVGPGTLLFAGDNLGDWFRGTAYVFSSACPSEPLGYRVEGPVTRNPLRVELRGEREVYRDCVPTGRWTSDRLLFTYSHDC